MRRFSSFSAAFTLLTTVGLAQQRPEYPEGSPVPRASTAAEAAWLHNNPLVGTDVVTPPPSGPIRCVAEYEPMDGIVISWEGPGAWLTILSNMAREITTTGDADVHVSVDTAGEQTSAASSLLAAGADMARVSFIIRVTDSIWMRDYGPRYVYQGDCRAIIDHTYNQPRPRDNMFNAGFAANRGHALYELPLVHGGGNYHLDALGRSRATRLIVNENPSRTEQQIFDIWASYQNVATSFYQPFPRSVDATQHIDMWMQMIADDAVIISDWPANVGSIQDQICDAAALSLAAEGYTVFRVPARSVGGTHYTYTNVVMCNDLVLIPTYTNATVAPHNAQALATWQAAVPTKTVVTINCQGIVTAQGVMHCIVMHVPEHRGGVNPTAHVVNLNGGEVLQPGQQVEIAWVTDDDVRAETVDVLLSTDGGSTFPTTLVAGRAASTRGWVWTVPDLCTGQARIRVVAHDGAGNTGSDDSDADFAIAGAGCTAASLAYGSGSPGQLGEPTLSSNLPVLGASLDLDLANAWPSVPAVLFLGGSPAAIPFAGGTFLVQPVTQADLSVSPGGTANLQVSLPNVLALAGQSLYWQAWVVGDPGGAFLLASTAGLETRLGF